jgi:hypothetical protein
MQSNQLEGDRFVAFLLIVGVVSVAFTAFTLVTFYIAHLSEKRSPSQLPSRIKKNH